MATLSTLAIIPARGGSARIPGKNLFKIAGKTLLEISIDHAKESTHVDRIIVSTEDSEITKVSVDAGIEVIERPESLATGSATSEQSLIHVLDHLALTESYIPDELVFLQCTSPFRRQDDIDSAISLFRSKNYDAVFSATRYRKYLWKLQGDEAKSINFRYDAERWMEQDFPSQFQENGSIYILKPWVLRLLSYRFGGKIGIHLMDDISALQIDEPNDLVLLENLMYLNA